MKKIAYMSPKMEVVEMKYQAALLNMSNGSGSTAPGTDDPEGI